MTWVYYMNANYTMYILNLYVGEISKTKHQNKETITNYNKNLNSAINETRQELKTLTEEHSSILTNLKDSTTWMKGILLIYSTNSNKINYARKRKKDIKRNLIIL